MTLSIASYSGSIRVVSAGGLLSGMLRNTEDYGHGSIVTYYTQNGTITAVHHIVIVRYVSLYYRYLCVHSGTVHYCIGTCHGTVILTCTSNCTRVHLRRSPPSLRLSVLARYGAELRAKSMRDSGTLEGPDSYSTVLVPGVSSYEYSTRTAQVYEYKHQG